MAEAVGGPTKCVADIAERQDPLLRCAPGAGRGAPGCFVLALAAVELDGANHLGADPRMCDPSRPSDRDRYPALCRVLVHEAAHADHREGQRPDLPQERRANPDLDGPPHLRNRIYTGDFHWHGRLHEIAIGGRVA